MSIDNILSRPAWTASLRKVQFVAIAEDGSHGLLDKDKVMIVESLPQLTSQGLLTFSSGPFRPLF